MLTLSIDAAIARAAAALFAEGICGSVGHDELEGGVALLTQGTNIQPLGHGSGLLDWSRTKSAKNFPNGLTLP